jgi:hypothetical protein
MIVLTRHSRGARQNFFGTDPASGHVTRTGGQLVDETRTVHWITALYQVFKTSPKKNRVPCQATRLSLEDPWLSVSVSRRIWLFLVNSDFHDDGIYFLFIHPISGKSNQKKRV